MYVSTLWPYHTTQDHTSKSIYPDFSRALLGSVDGLTLFIYSNLKKIADRVHILHESSQNDKDKTDRQRDFELISKVDRSLPF